MSKDVNFTQHTFCIFYIDKHVSNLLDRHLFLTTQNYHYNLVCLSINCLCYISITSISKDFLDHISLPDVPVFSPRLVTVVYEPQDIHSQIHNSINDLGRFAEDSATHLIPIL